MTERAAHTALIVFNIKENTRMKDHDFAVGMTMGLMAGAAMGIMVTPKRKRSIQKAADKARKTMGEVMEDLADELGMD